MPPATFKAGAKRVAPAAVVATSIAEASWPRSVDGVERTAISAPVANRTSEPRSDGLSAATASFAAARARSQRSPYPML